MPDAILRRVEMLLAILERVEQAAVPSLARLKRDVEAEAPVGRDSLARCTRHCNRHCTVKIPVGVGGAKPLPCLGPFSGDLATAHDAGRFHLEDIGEVASERDLKLEPHGLHAVVGDVEVFVHPTADRSADSEAKGARRNRAVLRKDGLIGQEDACRVIVDGPPFSSSHGSPLA